jgi:hypothetical protein
MSPAFSSTKQAAAFASLLLVLFLLPLVAGRPMLPPREELYSATSWAYGAFPYMHDQIFEEKGDIDIAFMGSSPMYWGIDTPYVQAKMSEVLGRPAVVRSLCWHYSGFDALYFIARDLLQHRKVRMIVFCDMIYPDPSNAAHRSTSKWFLWPEDGPEISGLDMKAKATFYAGAIVGMPRNLLDLARHNLPAIPSEEILVKSGYPKLKSPARRLGSLAVTWSAGHELTDCAPQGTVRPSDACVYSEATKTNFQFSRQPVPPTQIAFCRKMASLAREHRVKLVYLHFTRTFERASPVIETSAFWPEVFADDITMIGIPGAKLFAGISEGDLTNKLYNDAVHLNRNGQKFFTPLVTPGLVNIYENETIP